MTYLKLLISCIAIALLASPAGAARTEQAKAPWLLAQAERELPSCVSDNRKMPRGSQTCREGRLLRCGPYGNWVDTGKEC